MTNILFYLVIKPLSLLPLPLLYPISNVVYLIIYNVFGYRSKIVSENIKNSFPDKSDDERRKIMSGFYRFISNLMVETVWLFGLTEKKLRKRFTVENPEVMDEQFDRGKSVIIVLAHYSCWELVLSSLNLFVKHRAETIYVALSNKVFDKKFYEMRTKFGSVLTRKKDFRDSFKNNKTELRAIIFGADQSHAGTKDVHWTSFLNQDTAVARGVEKYAKRHDMPVIYAKLKPVTKGYFNLKLTLIESDPVSTKDGEITEKHVKMLEDQINEAPQYWLWSHRRWKKKRSNA